MPAKNPLIITEDLNAESSTDLSLKKQDGFETKLSSNFSPQTYSASEPESDEDVSESENDDRLVDPNETLEVSKAKQDESNEERNKFRGRPSSCVFVASLAASLTDDELSLSVTKHFQQWGALALVKVLRDTSNRPYAFVQYTNDDDANRALKEGQNSILDGRAIRCEHAKVNRTLYIATGDGKDISLKQIKESLYQFGEIEQMIGNNDSSYRKSNLNKAWFCKFAYRDDAIRAYANLRLSPEWIVEWAQNIEHPSEPLEKNTETEIVIDRFSIFVGQLDDRVTKAKLEERFSTHGKIIETTLVSRPGNNFAFIKFATENSAAASVERENHAVFMDKTMHVQYRELHHKRSRYSSSSATSPRPKLSLAPPPVNLPHRRASTGSGLQPRFFTNSCQPFSRSNRSPKYSIGRSVSFSNGNDRSAHSYHTLYGFPSTSQDSVSVGSQADENSENPQSYSPTQQHSPVSSPSNKTVDSTHGEAKSFYSSSTLSGENHIHDDSTDPTTSGHGTTKYQGGRRLAPVAVSSANPPVQAVRPPSMYYYYPGPKDNYVYDQNQYLSYPPYPYFFNESYVDFPRSAVGSAHGLPPVPYYMYYGVAPGTGYQDAKVKPYEKFEVHAESDEMDY